MNINAHQVPMIVVVHIFSLKIINNYFDRDTEKHYKCHKHIKEGFGHHARGKTEYP